MRAIWKGTISFGLVSIPIALYAAIRTNDLKFRLLRKSDLSPVQYKRVAEVDGKEVEWEEIVKGYEYEAGQFVVLTDEDFERVEVASTQSVDIMDFVQMDEIDPRFFDKPYFMEPQKGGDKAYVLLREAIKKSGRVGIAKVVIKTRQHLAAVKAQDKLLVLELMHFAQELADAGELRAPEGEQLSKKELDMAQTLVSQMEDRWEPQKYRDDYRESLMKLIEEKARKGVEALPTHGKGPRQPTKVIDLVRVLQQSLAETKAPGRKKAA